MTDQADLILRTLTPGEDIPYNLLLLADETNYEDAISRSYYALYYAAKALLSSKGIITKTHKGLITQISDHYVNNGLVDHQIWHTLAYTESLRESADYSTGEQITEEISLDVIEESKKNSFRYAKFWFYDKDKFNNKFMIPEKNRGGYQQYTFTSPIPSPSPPYGLLSTSRTGFTASVGIRPPNPQGPLYTPSGARSLSCSFSQ